jgi:hypothetical protein
MSLRERPNAVNRGRHRSTDGPRLENYVEVVGVDFDTARDECHEREESRFEEGQSRSPLVARFRSGAIRVSSLVGE